VLEPCPTDRDLERFLADRTGSDAGGIAAHVAGCESCRQRLEQLRRGDLSLSPAKTVLDVTRQNVVDRQYLLKDALPAGPRYTRTSLHAAGGMGSVWLARDTQVGRDVALKELRAEAATGPTAARFLREARITGQMEHPGVVPLYEIGHDAATGRPFYTMRFVRGQTLTKKALTFHGHRRAGQEEPLELVHLLTAFVSVCNTVAYAHSHGVIHRDLKGQNIILGDFGEAIVLDWGLAKRLDGSDDGLDAGPQGNGAALSQAGHTLMGEVIGTPAYMAPEQAEGRLDLVGPRTDVFGLGAILYEILTGSPPFAAADTFSVLRMAARADIPPPHTHWPDVPPGLEAACLRALARAPADRHATATELAQEVQGWQDKERRRAEDDLRRARERLLQQQAALVALTHSEVFTGPDLGATLRQMVEVASRTLQVERVSIWRFTDDRRAIRCQALYELGPGRHSAGVELNADAYPNYFAALAVSDVIAADDARRDPRTCEFTDSYLVPLGIGAMMEVPIPPDGVLCHEHVGPPRNWQPDEQMFGIAVGHLAAHVISQWERRKAEEELRLARDNEPGN
jgi:serine/threonine protein kinase